MEKLCSYDGGFTRKEANEAGLCGDCPNANCPYYSNNSNKKQKNSWSRTSNLDFNEPPRKKGKPKKKFVKKSYDDDD